MLMMSKLAGRGYRARRPSHRSHCPSEAARSSLRILQRSCASCAPRRPHRPRPRRGRDEIAAALALPPSPRRDSNENAAARTTHPPPPRRLVKNGPPAPRRRCVLDGRGLRADRFHGRAARRRAGARAGPRRGLADCVERAHRSKRGRLRRLLLPDVRPRAPRRDHRVPRAAARGRVNASLPRKKNPP